MTARSHRALPVRHQLGGLWLLCVGLLAGGGCATTTYRATELPPQFAAKPVFRLDNADLSKLASHHTRSTQLVVGDLLEIEVCSIYSDDEPTSVKVNVGPDGAVNVPFVGPVRVVNMTPEEAQFAINRAAKEQDVFRIPSISVRVEEQAMSRIAVSGAVMKPQTVEIPRGNCTLLSAILAAEGLAVDASAEVTIQRPARIASAPDALRGNPLRITDNSSSVVLAAFEEGAEAEEAANTYHVNLVTASEDGKGVFYLDDGDAVHVKRQPIRKVQVSGLVKLPGEYEMPANKDYFLSNALGAAGDASTQLADTLLVIRHMPGSQEPIAIRASIRDVRKNRGNILLQANDVVIVEETPVTIAFETLKSFFRFSIGSSLVLF